MSQPLDLEQIDLFCQWLATDHPDVSSASELSLLVGNNKKISSFIRAYVLETYIGRKKVARYYPELAKGYFTKTGLEQRTHPSIAKYHAREFSGCKTLLEIGTGLGFDTIFLAKTAQSVTTIELDPIHAQFANKNFEILGIHNVTVICDDAEKLLPQGFAEQFDAIWADPARRSSDVRTKDGEQFRPKLSLLTSLTNNQIGIKINPTDRNSYDGFIPQWIGLEGECKEKILWKTTHPIPAVYIVDHDCAVEPQSSKDLCSIRQEIPAVPCTFAEAHPALLASGYAESIFAEAGFGLFPGAIKVGVIDGSQHVTKYPGALRYFSIFRIEPFNLGSLKKILEELNWDNKTELKKFNYLEEPEEYRPRLNLHKASAEGAYGVVFFTRFGKKPIMCLGYRE